MDSNTTPVKEDILQMKYIKLLKTFLWTVGAWPGEAIGQHVPLIIRYHRIHAPLQSFIIMLGEIYHLYSRSDDMTVFAKGQIWVVTCLSVLTSARTGLPTFKKYGEITKNFLMSFHLIHFKHKGYYYKKINHSIDRISYFFTLYLMAMMVNTLVLFTLSPWYLNYKNGYFTGNIVENSTLELAVIYSFPGFDPADHFIFATIYNLYLSYNCALSICSTDLLLSLMVFQIIGHVLILRNNLETMPRPKKQTTLELNTPKEGVCYVTSEMFDAEENEIIHRKLVECVEHHRFIVSFTQDISDFFGGMLGLNYMYHLIGLCLLLLLCSQNDTAAVLRFGPLTFMTFGQLVQISIIFEVVNTVSEKLKDSIYLVPWECMDVKNRRTVCILLNRLQTPIQVTAMDMTSIGVTTMAGILKTTFSYFTFLRSMDL